MSNAKKLDLENRLIDFSVRIIQVTEALPDKKTGKHISTQLLRSGTSPAANYAEAQSAESKADFVHKIKVVLKELRETKVWLKMIVPSQLLSGNTRLNPLFQENDELISIFVKSEKTAKNNSQ
ncbi:MAG: four helix bundle protein [Kiritimatiellae bacterium]|nr:four helix bundle protein [Kiritimatiellia bacterium]